MSPPRVLSARPPASPSLPASQPACLSFSPACRIAQHLRVVPLRQDQPGRGRGGAGGGETSGAHLGPRRAPSAPPPPRAPASRAAEPRAPHPHPLTHPCHPTLPPSCCSARLRLFTSTRSRGAQAKRSPGWHHSAKKARRNGLRSLARSRPAPSFPPSRCAHLALSLSQRRPSPLCSGESELACGFFLVALAQEATSPERTGPGAPHETSSCCKFQGPPRTRRRWGFGTLPRSGAGPVQSDPTLQPGKAAIDYSSQRRSNPLCFKRPPPPAPSRPAIGQGGRQTTNQSPAQVRQSFTSGGLGRCQSLARGFYILKISRVFLLPSTDS